jgi:WD40 repeat protein
MKSLILIFFIGILSLPFNAHGQGNGGNDDIFGKLQPITADNVIQLKSLQTLGFWGINDLIWTPDGNTLVVAANHTLYFIPFDGNHLLRWDTTVFNVDAPIHAIALSTDGNYLATALENSTVPVWNIQDLNAIMLEHTFGEHTPIVYGVAFSPDGKLLATADASLVRVWELSSGKLKMTLPGHTAVVFSPDGSMIASASEGSEQWQYEHAVRIWDSKTGKELHTLKADTGIVQSLAFNTDGSQLMVGSMDNTPVIWHLEDEIAEVLESSTLPLEAYNSYVLNSAHFWDVAFDPLGNVAVGIRSDGQIHDWDMRSAPSIWLNEDIYLSNFRYRPNTITFHPQKDILTAGLGGTLVLMASGKVIETLGSNWGIENPVFHPENRWVAGLGDTVVFYDLAIGIELGNFATSNRSQNITISPDGRFLAIATWNHDPEVKQIEVWQVEETALGINGTFIQNFPYSTNQFTPVFNDEGHLLIESEMGQLAFVDVETGDIQSTLDYEGILLSLLQTPQGFIYATLVNSTQVELWTLVEASKQVAVFDTFTAPPQNFHTDQMWRTIPLDDESDGLWLIDTGFTPHQIADRIYFNISAITLDHSLLITSYSMLDSRPQAWDVQTGEIISLSEYGVEFNGTSIGFNQDDTLLIAGAEVWGIPQQE